jgi:hypothetical protein
MRRSKPASACSANSHRWWRVYRPEVIAVVGVGGGDRTDCGCEVASAVPGGEQVDVFAGSVQDAVRLHCIPAGQREPVLAGDEQPDFCQSEVDRFHSAGQRRRGISQLRETSLP